MSSFSQCAMECFFIIYLLSILLSPTGFPLRLSVCVCVPHSLFRPIQFFGFLPILLFACRTMYVCMWEWVFFFFISLTHSHSLFSAFTEKFFHKSTIKLWNSNRSFFVVGINSWVEWECAREWEKFPFPHWIKTKKMYLFFINCHYLYTPADKVDRQKVFDCWINAQVFIQMSVMAFVPFARVKCFFFPFNENLLNTFESRLNINIENVFDPLIYERTKV